MSSRPVCVLGAGFAGLVAARELIRAGIPVIVFEATGEVGGLARSFKSDDGFSFDFGAHFITNRLAAAIGVSASCNTVHTYGESVQLRGKTPNFPLGLVARPKYLSSALGARLRNRSDPPTTATDWFRREYGLALADEIALPIVEKWSGVSADQLSAAVGQKLGSTLETLWLMLAGKITRRAVAIDYCGEQRQGASIWHVYPETGVGLLTSHLAEEVGDVIRLNAPVEEITVQSDRVTAVRVGGESVEASAVFSTAPVHILPKLVTGTDALAHLLEFRFRPMVFANIHLEGRGLLPNVVLWTPESRFPFFRLTEAPLSMPWLAPAGKTTITVDVGCEVDDEIWSMDDESLGDWCLRHLEEIIPDIHLRYLGCRVLRTPIAYPVFLETYEKERRSLERSTGVEGLYSIGRNGEFAHILLEDVYWRTLRRVRTAIGEIGT